MSETEKAVQKATDSKVTAPKRKHVRTIIIECWNENSARTFFTEVAKRPVDSNDVVCFKAFTTVHKVLQEGPRQVLVDGYYRLQWVDVLREYWDRQIERGYSHLNCEYADFLHNKILFHHRNTEFEGDISLEKFLKQHKPESFDLDKSIEFVTQLINLQESVFKLQSAVIATRDVNECKAGSLIPLVLESYAIYTLVTYILTKTVDRVESLDSIQFLIERYYGQYMTLREFYVNISAIRSVSSVIAVPNLPPDPPTFAAKKSKDKPRVRKGNTPTVPKREAPKVELQLQSQPQFEPQLLIDPFPTPQPPQIQYQSTIPTWSAYTPPPVTAQPLQLTSPLVHTPPSANTTVLPSQTGSTQWVTFGQDTEKKSDDPFHSLLSIAKTEPTGLARSRSATLPEDKIVEPARSISPTPLAQPAGATAAPVTEKTRVVTKIITKTVNNTAELNKLKARIEELESELLQEKETNRKLIKQLQERDASAMDLVHLSQKLELAYTESEKEVEMLREELNALLDAQHQERWSRAVSEISKGKEHIEMSLAGLDSPLNLGNQNATAATVVEQANSLRQFASRLVEVCESAEDESFNQMDLFSAVSAVSGAVQSLFTDAKGASRLIEDQVMRQKLLESARLAGIETASLLEIIRAQGGQPQDEEERKALKDILEKVLGTITGVVDASKEVEISQTKQQMHTQEEVQTSNNNEIDQSGIDLDDLAERELLNAAKTIEDAAKTLLAARAAKPPKKPNDTRPDVDEAILEAAMAITHATSTLVASAAAAQRERADKGRIIAATGTPYRRDPTWAEGLISAAKAVAQATAALVGVANDAVQNKKESGGEEGLIAVSKAVAAATSQLVAAARSKSESNSPIQEKLSVAAKSVSHATSLLVSAARAAATKDDKEGDEDFSKLSTTGYKVREMEQTMQILRLEKELEKARKVLLSMRKAEYARNNPE